MRYQDLYGYDDILDEFINNEEWEQDMERSEEAKIYAELVTKVQGSLNLTGVCFASDVWESVNHLVDILTSRNSSYSRFKIIPRKNGNGIDCIDYEVFRIQLMSLLGRMSADYNLGDTSYNVYHNLPSTGTMAVAHANNQNNQNQSNSQENNNTQSVTLTLDQRISTIEQLLENNLSNEQLEKIKPIFQEFKDEPTKWATAQKLISSILGFGKSISIEVISHVINSQIV